MFPLPCDTSLDSMVNHLNHFLEHTLNPLGLSVILLRETTDGVPSSPESTAEMAVVKHTAVQTALPLH